jgi:DNA-binding transcriptional LysR family regulator
MKSYQRFIGWALVALGGISLFVGSSPLFPIGLEAFLLGGSLFAAGAWVLAGKELRDTIRRGLRAWSELRRSGRGIGSRGNGRGRLRGTGGLRGTSGSGGPVFDRLLPVRILKLAQQHGGVLTVARVAMGLNVPLDQAQAGLDECVRAGNAVPDYDVVRGHALYRFPEFLEPEPPRLPG